MKPARDLRCAPASISEAKEGDLGIGVARLGLSSIEISELRDGWVSPSGTPVFGAGGERGIVGRFLGHYGGLRQRVIDLTQARDDYGVIEFPKRRIPSPRERHGPTVIRIAG